MKKIVSVVIATVICAACYSQKANVTWGEEFKLKKGSADLSVIYVDNSGVFVKESHYVSKMFTLFGNPWRESATLIKLDKNLNELYNTSFNKELKGKDFEQFYIIKDKLYLFASENSNKGKTITLYGAEIDKNSGLLAGEWSEITSWSKEEKKEEINFRADYNADSSRLILVSTIEGKEKNNYEIRQFDDRLKPVGKAIAVTNEFEPKTYVLEDVVYTDNGNAVLVGKEYEYQEGRKKKDKYLDFKNYSIRIYDNTGEQIKDISTGISGKWLMSTKVAQSKSKELVVAAFYSNAKRANEINGMMIQRINPATGDIISTHDKEINTAMLSAVEGELNNDDDDGDSESRKEKMERLRFEKVQSNEDGFSKYMRFRNFIATDDNGLVILAEKYHSIIYEDRMYTGSNGTSPGSNQVTKYKVFECGDIMMCKMSATGEVAWLNVLPKMQRERIQLQTGEWGGSFSYDYSYFIPLVNWPFYAGFNILPAKNSVNIIFNDNKKNANVLQLGQKIKVSAFFRKSDCFNVNLNTATGKYTRNSLFSNEDVPTAMPRLGRIFSNQLFLVGKEDRIFGKTKIAVAKLSIK